MFQVVPGKGTWPLAGLPNASQEQVGSCLHSGKNLTPRVQMTRTERLLKPGLSIEEATREPQAAALSLWEVRKKGAWETGSRDQPLMSCCCPLLPCLQVSWGSLELRRPGLWGKKERALAGEGAVPQRESTQGNLCLEAFMSLLLGDCQGSSLNIQQNILQFSRCAPPALWSPVIGQCQGRGSLLLSHWSQSWCHPPDSAAFLGLELKSN